MRDRLHSLQISYKRLSNLKFFQKANRPFASFPGPLYQNEVRRSTFDMEMMFHSHANKTHFHKKGSAPNLVLIQRPGELGDGLFGLEKFS